MSDFYVYRWHREDDSPYYVGKGKNKRAFRTSGPSHDRIQLRNVPDEQSAFVLERFLIAFHGRKDNGTGILRNLTAGGEGTSGRIVTEENRLSSARGGRKNVETGHLARISSLGGKASGPIQGVRNCRALDRNRKSNASKGGITQGNRHVASGHCARIAHLGGLTRRGKRDSAEARAAKSLAMKASWARRQQKCTAR